jgi:hypothetical protein
MWLIYYFYFEKWSKTPLIKGDVIHKICLTKGWENDFNFGNSYFNLPIISILSHWVDHSKHPYEKPLPPLLFSSPQKKGA